MNSPHPRELLTAYFDRSLTPDEFARLERWLADDPSAARELALATYVHRRLRDLSQGEQALAQLGGEEVAQTDDVALGETMVLPALQVADTVPDGADAFPAAPAVPRPAAPRHRLGRRAWVAAAAAALVISLGIWAWTSSRAAGASHATLAAAVDAAWGETGNPPRAAARMPTGPLRLRHGQARIVFDSGAEVIVAAPARLEVRSARELVLTEGKITARVAPAAAGFTVLTPAGRVTDLGTEFGVLVDASRGTEAHVIRGVVELQPAGAAPKRLTAGTAGRARPGQAGVDPIACRPDDFIHALPQIDLVDVVAGGDGKGSRTGRGIDVRDGTFADAEPSPIAGTGDRTFRSVAGSPYVVGVFVPIGGAGTPTVLDPAGHTFDGFPGSIGQTFHHLWAGGRIPLAGGPEPSMRPVVPERLGGVDYGSPPRRLLFVHPSKGVVFDLAALRGVRSGSPLSRFRATCQNTSAEVANPSFSDRAALWVFVDGQLRFKRLPIARTDPAFEVDVPLGTADRYLTIVTTDGGDGFIGDWVVFGDPRLE